MTANRYKVSFLGNENILGLVVMMHNFENILRNTELNTLKGKKVNKIFFYQLSSAWRMNSLESLTSQHFCFFTWLTISRNPKVFLLSFSVRDGISSLAKRTSRDEIPTLSSRGTGMSCGCQCCVLFRRTIHRGSQRLYLAGKHVLKCPLSLEVELDCVQKIPSSC